MKIISLLRVVSIVAFTCAVLPARAEYPDQPIKLVLPFPPGGETDPFARTVGSALSKGLGRDDPWDELGAVALTLCGTPIRARSPAGQPSV